MAYAQAGNPTNPTVLLLHGFPTSSKQFRNLIPLLADRYHVLAPDLPTFGNTTILSEYHATFALLAKATGEFLDALKITEFAMYVFDYGAPTGFRLAMERSDLKIRAIITQNGSAYEASLGAFWDPIKVLWGTKADTPEFRAAVDKLAYLVGLESTKWQYEEGTPSDRLHRIDPSVTYKLDYYQNLFGEQNINNQVELLYDYRNNVNLYPQFQNWIEESRVPVLAVWGKGDQIFIPQGARAYEKDVRGEFQLELLDGGHFLLETHIEEVASSINGFFQKIGF